MTYVLTILNHKPSDKEHRFARQSFSNPTNLNLNSNIFCKSKFKSYENGVKLLLLCMVMVEVWLLCAIPAIRSRAGKGGRVQ